MLIAGLVIAGIGVLAFLGFFLAGRKAGRVMNTPLVKTGELAAKGKAIADDKGGVSVEGKVICADPLISRITHTPALHYRYKVMAKWKVGEETKTYKIDEGKAGTVFEIDDGSGPCKVDTNESIDCPEKVEYSETKGRALLKMSKTIEFTEHYTLQAGQDYGKTRIPDDAKYTVTETVVPVPATAYCCGHLNEDGALVQKLLSSMLFTSKGRDALLADSASTSKRTKMIGMVCVPVGLLLVIIGAVTGGTSSSSGSSKARTNKGAKSGKTAKAGKTTRAGKAAKAGKRGGKKGKRGGKKGKRR